VACSKPGRVCASPKRHRYFIFEGGYVHACHVLCRARVVEEIPRRKGTATAEHLKYVLSVVDGPRFPAEDTQPGPLLAHSTGFRPKRGGVDVTSSRFNRSSTSKNPSWPRMRQLRIHPTRWNQKCCRSTRFLEPSAIDATFHAWASRRHCVGRRNDEARRMAVNFAEPSDLRRKKLQTSAPFR
jgi:hypothetical protein